MEGALVIIHHNGSPEKLVILITDNFILSTVSNKPPINSASDLCTGQCWKGRGECTSNNSRCRHSAQGADTNGRGWRGAGVDNVQVDGVPHQKRKLVIGETDSCYD